MTRRDLNSLDGELEHGVLGIGRERHMFKFQVQFLLFPFYNMTHALSSVHPLILFCLDDAHDGLADAWGTT
jgi:hypothetical protein